MRTAESLRSIVGTMRTLALVNSRRFERAAASLGEYSQPIRLALHVVVSALEWEAVESLPRPDGEGVAVVLGTDHGLCGQFNDRATSYAGTILAEGRWSILVMGQRLGERMRESGHDVLRVIEAPTTVEAIPMQAQRLLIEVGRLQETGRCCRLILIYNELLTGFRYRETRRDLLPFEFGRFRNLPGDAAPFATLPQPSPSARKLIHSLLPEYFLAELCLCIAHSSASENAARLMAMESGARSIDDRIELLTEEYHRRRQEEITTELIDVLTGSEAVRGTGD